MGSNLKVIFLDMDGVVWRDLTPIGDLPANLSKIESLGLQSAFITNNATRSKRHYIDVFAQLHTKVKESQIYTSAYACASALAEDWPAGGPLYIIGESGLHNALAAHSFTPWDTGEPLAVVAGLDRQVDYDQLKAATLHIRNGVPFIGTNPDRTLPTPEGQIPGAGAIIAFLEASTGQKARIIGKPQPAMLHQALKDLELSPDQALMVGDRLETDIAAGQNAGCQTALVLSGASTPADLNAWPQPPDYVAADLTALLEQLG